MADTVPPLVDGQELTEKNGVSIPSLFKVASYSYMAYIFDEEDRLIGSAIVDNNRVVDYDPGDDVIHSIPKVKIRLKHPNEESFVIDSSFFYDIDTKTKLFRKPTLVEEPVHLDALDAYDDWILEFNLSALADLTSLRSGIDQFSVVEDLNNLSYNNNPLRVEYSTEGSFAFRYAGTERVDTYYTAINTQIGQTKVDRVGMSSTYPPGFMIVAKDPTVSVDSVSVKWRTNGLVSIFYARHVNKNDPTDMTDVAILMTANGRLDVVVSDTSDNGTSLQFFILDESRLSKTSYTEYGGFSLPVAVGDTLHVSNVSIAAPQSEPLTFTT